MKYNLIVNYYTDNNENRQHELSFCILENIKNKKIDNVLIVSNQADFLTLMEICPDEYKNKIILKTLDSRPTYNHYFEMITKEFSGNDNINVLSNLDIIIPEESLSYMLFYLTEEKSCLALTRYDINNISDYKNNSTFFERVDSQDTWIFKGSVPNIAGANYGLGIAGCDNGIAHLLEQSGYVVKNPSRTIKTYHYHITNVRNYTNVVGQAIQRIPPPYKLLPPTI